jgi:hypothetical protein
MKLKCIGCEALARLLYHCAAESEHIVDIKLLKIGLHDTPEELRSQLQREIDSTFKEEYDTILLAYGLCGQASVGLEAKEIPIVIPRAHDCITLFLGARKRYEEEIKSCPGTYWYASDYIERSESHGTALSLGTELTTNVRELYQQYVEQYGAENADYIMETTGAWQNHYQRAVYINMGVGESKTVKTEAEVEANKRGWRFENLKGDLRLIQHLLSGNWQEDFLIVEPGNQISMSYDKDVIKCL